MSWYMYVCEDDINVFCNMYLNTPTNVAYRCDAEDSTWEQIKINVYRNVEMHIGINIHKYTVALRHNLCASTRMKFWCFLLEAAD